MNYIEDRPMPSTKVEARVSTRAFNNRKRRIALRNHQGAAAAAAAAAATVKIENSVIRRGNSVAATTMVNTTVPNTRAAVTTVAVATAADTTVPVASDVDNGITSVPLNLDQESSSPERKLLKSRWCAVTFEQIKTRRKSRRSTADEVGNNSTTGTSNKFRLLLTQRVEARRKNQAGK